MSSDARCDNASVDRGRILACQDCDLLQREIAVLPGGSARCGRCGAVLYRNPRHGLDRTLAFLLAAAVVFVIANVYPVIVLEAEGIRTFTTLCGAVRLLWLHHMHVVSLLVFATAVLAPAVEIGAMLYILLPLKLCFVPAGFAPVLRFLQSARPWEMVEVFMLGLLVSVVRVSQFAMVVPGIAFWSFGALTLLLAAAAACFSGRDVWHRAEKASGRSGGGR